MKRYVIFCPHYLPHLGGVERYTYNLASELIKRGHEVIVVTSLIDDLPEQEISDSIEIYRLPSILLLDGRFPVVKPSKTWKKVKEILNEAKADLYIIQTRFYLLSLLGVRFANKTAISSIVIEHGTAHFSVNNPLLDWMGHFYEHWITSRVKRLNKYFYGVSAACNNWLMHYKIQANGILYNAVDLIEIRRFMKKPVKDYKKELNIPSDAFIVTYTGRLLAAKGVLKLIESVEQLSKKYDCLFLMIAGIGDLYDEVKKKSGYHIHCLGQIDYQNIIALLKQTDIFCLPTDYPEGFPTSVLEAAACECFVITTTSGGSKELISNNSYGIILKENSVEMISESIERVMLASDYRKQAVTLTYQRLLEQFTWEKNARIIENLH